MLWHKKLYLGTPLSRYKHINIPIDILPQEIIVGYFLINLSHNGYIYCKICKWMYSLPHVGILPNQQLVQWLSPKVHTPCKHTPGLWRNKWRPITFSWVVDDFGVKCVCKQHADYLINTIQDHYQVSTDWKGKRYCGISIKWNYQKQVVILSMPGYIQAALNRFQHSPPTIKEHAQHSWEQPNYGSTHKFTKADYTYQKLPT